MTLQELYAGIGLQPELAAHLERLAAGFDWAKKERYIAGMLEPDTAQQSYTALRGVLLDEIDLGNYKMLLCQLEAARRCRARYAAAGMPDAVFWDTMGCFARFCAECREKTGSLHFDRGWWTWRQISMRLFRLGALEYELRDRDGEKTVAVHIPSGADLSPAAVDASLAQAAAFWAQHHPTYAGAPHTCHSWLLSPALTEFLDEGSNILAFQKRFTLTGTDDGDEFIEWLFRRPCDTPAEELPETTRLQRAVKAMLLESDEGLGAGVGMLT